MVLLVLQNMFSFKHRMLDILAQACWDILWMDFPTHPTLELRIWGCRLAVEGPFRVGTLGVPSCPYRMVSVTVTSFANGCVVLTFRCWQIDASEND